MEPMLIPFKGANVFFWNVSGAVGERGDNRPEDVALIQFFYRLLPENRAILLNQPSTPRFIEICQNVAGEMSGHCSGQPADPLVNLIRNHQKELNWPVVDGRVSRATPTGQFELHGPRVRSTFMILQMMTLWRFTQFDCWPRLDYHPACPPLVKAAVVRTFG
jgi:hypothetical protein